jgi:hypothetical protein
MPFAKGFPHGPAIQLEGLPATQPRVGPGEGVHGARLRQRHPAESAAPRVRQPRAVQEGLPDPRRDPQRRDRQGVRVRQGPVRRDRSGGDPEAPGRERPLRRDRGVHRRRPARPDLSLREDLLPGAGRRGGAEALRPPAAGPGGGGAARARTDGPLRQGPDRPRAPDGGPPRADRARVRGERARALRHRRRAGGHGDDGGRAAAHADARRGVPDRRVRLRELSGRVRHEADAAHRGEGRRRGARHAAERRGAEDPEPHGGAQAERGRRAGRGPAEAAEAAAPKRKMAGSTRTKKKAASRKKRKTG